MTKDKQYMKICLIKTMIDFLTGEISIQIISKILKQSHDTFISNWFPEN